MNEIRAHEEVLTLEEASAFLKLSKSTLYNLARKGEVPVRKIGRSWRFSKASLLKWLENK
ncbi:MAG: helix-turn-helix domain-containing protein [Candidatus Omnitrophica bacterium]|nr:helix-turn-helix domain-containing protein [Candidatus Omnitrophota bacterium]